MSVQKLAEACFVSSGSVLKFCQALGISSFSAFKKALGSTIETRRLQLFEKYRSLSEKELKEKMNEFVHDQKIVENLAQDAKQLARAIEKNGAIHLYGAMFPLALSLSFAEDACVLDHPVYFHQGSWKNQPEQGVHVLITFSGRWIESDYDACARISRANDPVVLMTSSLRTLPNVSQKIVLPKFCSNEYMNIFYLLFLDLVLLELIHLA